MKKNKLLKELSKIKGNPEIFIEGQRVWQKGKFAELELIILEDYALSVLDKKDIVKRKV